MTEQSSAYGSEDNQSELILESNQSDLSVESSEPEPASQTQTEGLNVWEQLISVHDSLPDFILPPPDSAAAIAMNCNILSREVMPNAAKASINRSAP